MSADTWMTVIEIVGNLAQIAAVLLGLFGFFAAIRQLRISAETNKVSADANKAMAWLEVRKMLLQEPRDSIHRKLRDRSRILDRNQIDQASLDAYLGLSEHLKFMLDDGLIDWPTFQQIYGYRIGNIMFHRDIAQAKLADDKGWDLLKALVIMLKESGYPLENTDLIHS